MNIKGSGKNIIVRHEVSCLSFVGPHTRIFKSLGNGEEGIVVRENVCERTTCCKVEISSGKRYRGSTKGSNRCFKECYVRILMVANDRDD